MHGRAAGAGGGGLTRPARAARRLLTRRQQLHLLHMVLLLALLALAAASKEQQRWLHDRGAALKLGIELYRSGRTSRLQDPLEGAVRVLSRAIELSDAIEPGQTAVPHFYLGAALVLLERDVEAEAAYQKSIALDNTLRLFLVVDSCQFDDQTLTANLLDERLLYTELIDACTNNPLDAIDHV